MEITISPKHVTDLETDAPVSSIEKDAFGWTSIADQLARTLVHSVPVTSGSFVVSLEGEWGTGKSSFLSFFRTHLKGIKKENTTNVIIDYAPWLYPSVDHTKYFFELLSRESKLEDKKIKSFSKKLAFPQQVISSFNATLSSLAIGVLGILIFFFGINQEEFVEFIPNWAALPIVIIALIMIFIEHAFSLITKISLKYRKPINEIKDSLRDHLKKSKIKLFVLIDDVDRLTGQEMLNLFQLVKNNANLPNIIFVLCMDTAQVQNALDSIGIKDPGKYLEKLVQLRFNIPVITREQLKSYVIDRINNLYFKEYADFKEHWVTNDWGQLFETGIFPLIRTARDCNRLFNCCESRLRSIGNSEYTEINPIDFIGIETIRVFLPQMYSKLYSAKSLLIGPMNDMERLLETDGTGKEQRQGQYLSLQETIPEEQREWGVNILEFLFPRLPSFRKDRIGNNSEFSEGRAEAFSKLSDSTVFDTYFCMNVRNVELSASHVTKYFDHLQSEVLTEEEVSLGDWVMAFRVWKRVLRRCHHGTLTMPMDLGIKQIIENLMRYSDRIPDNISADEFSGILNFWLKSIKNPSLRNNHFIAAIRETKSFFGPATVLLSEIRKSKEVEGDHTIFGKDGVLGIKTTYLEIVENPSDKKRLFESERIVTVLWYLKDIWSKDKLAYFLESVLRDTDQFTTLVAKFYDEKSEVSLSGHPTGKIMKKFYVENFVELLGDSSLKLVEDRLLPIWENSEERSIMNSDIGEYRNGQVRYGVTESDSGSTSIR